MGFYNGVFHASLNQTGAFPFGKWTHVVSTYDGAVGKLYINGVLNNSVSDAFGLPSSTDGWYLGHRWDNTTTLNGFIDDARIYKRALSASEVKQLYQAVTSKLK